jgi:hypothetical protein
MLPDPVNFRMTLTLSKPPTQRCRRGPETRYCTPITDVHCKGSIGPVYCKPFEACVATLLTQPITFRAFHVANHLHVPRKARQRLRPANFPRVLCGWECVAQFFYIKSYGSICGPLWKEKRKRCRHCTTFDKDQSHGGARRQNDLATTPCPDHVQISLI